MNNENPYEFLGGAPEETVSSSIGIFVYVEVKDDKIFDESLIALGKARELANMLGTGVAAVLLNSNQDKFAQIIFQAGGDRVFMPQDNRYTKFDSDPYSTQMTALLKEHQPEIVLAGLSAAATDFLPRLAQRLQTGLISGGIGLEVDTMERVLLVTRPIYGGKMHEVQVCPSARPQIVLLMPSAFPQPILDTFRHGEIEKI